MTYGLITISSINGMPILIYESFYILETHINSPNVQINARIKKSSTVNQNLLMVIFAKVTGCLSFYL